MERLSPDGDYEALKRRRCGWAVRERVRVRPSEAAGRRVAMQRDADVDNDFNR